MRALLLICALMLASGAAAEDTPVGFGRTVVEPPAKWRFEPADRVELHYLPQAKVIGYCSRATGKFEDIGCSWPASPEFPQCLIVIAKETIEPLKELVLIHEKAHCNGWLGHHPVD